MNRLRKRSRTPRNQGRPRVASPLLIVWVVVGRHPKGNWGDTNNVPWAEKREEKGVGGGGARRTLIADYRGRRCKNLGAVMCVRTWMYKRRV